MAFNTGNPLGSTDPRDFSDNSENLDRAVNNSASATWTDRFGNSRTTLAGQIGYRGTGTDGAIESYAAGLVLESFSTIILYNNEFYRPSASATLPYTTTATTPDIDSNLVAVGDAVLRQDLAGDPSDGNGATLVNGATIYVGSVAELGSLQTASLADGQQVFRREFWPETNTGEVSLYWDSSRPVSEHNGGTIIDPARISEIDAVNKTFGTYFTPDSVSGNTGCFVASAVEEQNSEIYGAFGAVGYTVPSIAETLVVSGVRKVIYPYGTNGEITALNNSARPAAATIGGTTAYLFDFDKWEYDFVNGEAFEMVDDALTGQPSGVTDLIDDHLTVARFVGAIEDQGATDNTDQWQLMFQVAKDLRQELILPAGNYALKTGGARVDYDNLKVSGQGRSETQIWNFQTGIALNVGGNTGPSTNIRNLVFENFSIYGNVDPVNKTGDSGDAVYLDGVGNNLVLRNMNLHRCKNGIYSIDAFTVKLDSVYCQHNKEWGLWTQSASNAWTVVASIFNFNGTAGFGGARIGGLGNVLIGCNFEGNKGDQLFMNGLANSVKGGYIEKPAKPPGAMVRINGCTGWQIDGTFFDTLGGETLDNPGTDKYQMVVVEAGSAWGTLTSGTLLKENSDDGTAVTLDATSGGNNTFYIRDTDEFINNASATNIALLGSRVPNEYGGTTTLSDGGTIAHGLGSTPSRWTLTPLSASPFVATVTARDDTNLTIGLFDMTGAAIAGTRTISWTVSK